MNTQSVKLLLLFSLIFQYGCDISLKRKNTPQAMDSVGMNRVDSKSANKKIEKKKIYRHDFKIINSFYLDKENKIIREDMIKHTVISKKQEKNLQVGNVIPRDILALPLPIELEKRLPAIPLNTIRVQVGRYIILMNVKSREIIDVFKI